MNKSLEKSTDIVIHFALSDFNVKGGNGFNDCYLSSWAEAGGFKAKAASQIIWTPAPDVFIAFGTELYDLEDHVLEALTEISEHHAYNSEEADYIDKKFKKYGLKIEDCLRTEESVVYIDLKYKDAINRTNYMSTDSAISECKRIAKFYMKREARLKDIEKRHKVHFTSKKYGL